METVAYLGDAQFRDAEKERSFHQEHLVDIVDNCAVSVTSVCFGSCNCTMGRYSFCVYIPNTKIKNNCIVSDKFCAV